MTVYVSFSWSDSKLSLLSFFFILDKVIILIAWALNETFDIEASNSTSETIDRISLNSCFYLTVKYISAYIFKTFDKSLSSNLSVLFSILSHHHQWNTFRPIILLRPDSQPPEPHILYPSISILFHTIPFHSPLSVFLRAERFQTHNLLPSMSISYDRSKQIQIIPYI